MLLLGGSYRSAILNKGGGGGGEGVMLLSGELPCSPVQVPPIAIALSAILPASRFASVTSLG